MNIGDEVRLGRESAGMSQAALAAAMVAHGHRWYQTTVTRIETGDRDLRWAEGIDLRELIEFDTDSIRADVYRDARAYQDIVAIVEGRGLEQVSS